MRDSTWNWDSFWVSATIIVCFVTLVLGSTFYCSKQDDNRAQTLEVTRQACIAAGGNYMDIGVGLTPDKEGKMVASRTERVCVR